VNGLSFKKDAADNIIVASIPALKVIKILFEGQTRKIGANNFLRHIYTSKFSKILIPQLQEVIIRRVLNDINAKKQK
jgi:transcriptional regulator of met regulon